MTTKPATDAEMMEMALRASTKVVGVMAPPDWEDRITALKAALATARADALEEVAKVVADEMVRCRVDAPIYLRTVAHRLDTAIRALKEPTP
jgi:hypothetical protein